MRIALLSDIHANALALDAVLDKVNQKNIEHIWFLGDAVGRGPQSITVLDWLQDHIHSFDPDVWVSGNHDSMLTGLLTPAQLQLVNEPQKIAIEKHREIVQNHAKAKQFTETQFIHQRSEPRMRVENKVNYVLVHGCLIDPPGFFYYLYPWRKYYLIPENIKSLYKIQEDVNLPNVMIFGHTHVPTLISASKSQDGFKWDAEKVFPGQTYKLDPKYVWMLNPGSVGQPRDMDNRAAYAILDTQCHTVTYHRVEYPWRTVARQLVLDGYDQLFETVLKNAIPTKETPQEWLDHYMAAREISDE